MKFISDIYARIAYNIAILFITFYGTYYDILLGSYTLIYVYKVYII